MNRVELIGRLTKDPEMRQTQTGKTVCSFTLAVNRRARKTEGQQEADFISCVAWNKTADVLKQYTSKGSQIGVEGKIQTRNYENQQGQRVYVTEVLVDSIDLLEKPRDMLYGKAESGNAVSRARKDTSTANYGYGMGNYSSGVNYRQNAHYEADTASEVLGPEYDDLPF